MHLFPPIAIFLSNLLITRECLQAVRGRDLLGTKPRAPVLEQSRTAGIYNFVINNIVVATAADRAQAPAQAEAEPEPAPEQEPVPPPPAAPPQRPPGWVFWAPGARRRRPQGCRCNKSVFREHGCDGVQCRRTWTSFVGDHTPRLGPALSWRRVVSSLLRTHHFRGFWGVLGNYWKIINAIGEAVNAAHGVVRRRQRRVRGGSR